MKRSLLAVFAIAGVALVAGIAFVAAAHPFAAVANGGSRHTPTRDSSPTKVVHPVADASTFQPPALDSIPDNQFGKMVRLGMHIFDQTPRYAGRYIGNHLSCSNCHLDSGRLAGSAPMWAAWVSYPAWRSKNRRVNTFADRLRGCFRYSMNGTPPPLGSKTLLALQSYAYWMAQGAPVDPKIAGRGYPDIARPAVPPAMQRGAAVYAENCALCHGKHGQGQRDARGRTNFPALWGPDSFNWGAGMASLNRAAAFIRANMPLGKAGTLSVQDTWDVALYIDAHERPQDPRFTGSVPETRRRFHDTPDSMYGKPVAGHVLGQGAVPAGGKAKTGTDRE